jgi:hypothetical protein
VGAGEAVAIFVPLHAMRIARRANPITQRAPPLAAL